MGLGEQIKYNEIKEPIFSNDECIKINGKIIDKIAIFKYLGYKITSDNSNKNHIGYRKQIAIYAADDLNKAGFYGQLLNADTKA